MPACFRLGWPWALASLALGLCAAVALLGTGDVMVDEAIQAATAWRMVQGSTLYTELHAFAGPLPQLLLMPLYWAFGPSIWAPRLALLLAVGASLWLLAQGVRRLGGSQAAACLAGAFFVLAALPAYRAWYHHWLALPLALGALYVAGCALNSNGMALKRGPWWGAGILAGLSAACTQSTGLAIALALGAGVGLMALGAAWPWRDAWRALGALVGGFVAPWILLWLGFAAKGAGGALWWRCWLWPWFGYRVAGSFNDQAPGRDLPALLSPMAEALSQPFWMAKALHHLSLLLLPWAAAVGGFLLLFWWLRGAWQGKVAAWPGLARENLVWGLAVLAVVGAMAQGRADLAHHAFVAPMAFAWAIAQASRLWAQLQPASELQAGPDLALAHSAPFLILLLLVLASAIHEANTWRSLAREGRWGWCDSVAAADPMLRALQARLPHNASLVAFPEGGLFYLLGGGVPATPFLLLAPKSYRYQSLEDFQLFSAAWAASAPQAVVLTRMTAPQAVAEWGGSPSLAGYRLLHEGRTRISGTWQPAQLWWRMEAGDRP